MTIVENPTITITGGVDTQRRVPRRRSRRRQQRRPGRRHVQDHDRAGFGEISLVGVEGTGSYGAGLARHLAGKGIRVVEVDRPNRQARHRAGKSDSVNAIAAARAALTGTATGVPKSRTGSIEAIRFLTVARRSAADEWISIINQMRHIVFCAPDEIRARFIDLSPIRLPAPAQHSSPADRRAMWCGSRPCPPCASSAAAPCSCATRSAASTRRCGH